MTPFSESSYLAQVRRLREMAKLAVARYPIRVAKIEFINHGENATFQVSAYNGRKYLLRIHRDGYHSKEAILEELNWLALLAKRDDLLVPKPVLSKAGQLIETVSIFSIQGARHACLFEWLEGRFIDKSLSENHMHELGKIISVLQKTLPRAKSRHRNYWLTEGIVGEAPKFGPYDALTGVTPQQQALITRTRKLVRRKLLAYEEKFPKRQSLIHTDLHFGNVMQGVGRLATIDFDDCGVGFHVYDLVAPLLSAEYSLGPKEKEKFLDFRVALIEGYKEQSLWDSQNEDILLYLQTARKLGMLGWLNSRAENPRLRSRLKGAVKRALEWVRKHHDIA